MMTNNTKGNNLEALLSLNSLWQETQGHPDICIAVLDGPVDKTHPYFEGARLKYIDFDESGISQKGPAILHGTHISSIIFGQHSSNMRGLAPGCQFLQLSSQGIKASGEIIRIDQVSQPV